MANELHRLLCNGATSGQNASIYTAAGPATVHPGDAGATAQAAIRLLSGVYAACTVALTFPGQMTVAPTGSDAPNTPHSGGDRSFDIRRADDLSWVAYHWPGVGNLNNLDTGQWGVNLSGSDIVIQFGPGAVNGDDFLIRPDVGGTNYSVQVTSPVTIGAGGHNQQFDIAGFPADTDVPDIEASPGTNWTGSVTQQGSAPAPPGVPDAPDHFTKPFITIEGAAGTLSLVAQDPLPDGADYLQIYRRNDQDDTGEFLLDATADVAEVGAGETVTIDINEGDFLQLLWMAHNDTGETPGPSVMLEIGAYAITDGRTPEEPAISAVRSADLDATRPSDPVTNPTSALIVRADADTDEDYWDTLSDGGGFARSTYHPTDPWALGASKTLPDAATIPLPDGFNPETDYKARWLNAPDGAFSLRIHGPIHAFSTAAAVTTPSAPVITGYNDSSPTTATVTVPPALPGDLVSLDYWEKAGSGAWALIQAGLEGGDTVSRTGLVVGVPYQCRYRGYNSDGDYADGPVTSFTPGSSTGGASPPAAPDELTDTDVTDVSITYILPALPARADTLRLLFKLASDPDSTYAIPSGSDGLAGGATVVVEGLTLSTKYRAKAVAVSSFGSTDGPVHDTKTEAVAPAASAPATPAAPTCTGKTKTTATIKQPSWPATTTSLLLKRRLASGTDDDLALVHTYASSGEIAFTDTGLVSLETYVYKVLARNATGDSALSPALTVALISSKATVTWQEPAASATLSGDKLFRFGVVDTGGATTNQRLILAGQNVSGVVRASGTAANGVYRATADMRDYADGAATGRAIVEGSDHLEAYADRSFTIDNSREAATKYQPLEFNDAPDGSRYAAASINSDRPAPSGNPARRYWMQLGITTDDTTFDAVDWADTGEEARALQAAAFSALQPVALALNNAPRPQITAYASLNVRGPAFRACVRLTPQEALSTFETGLELGGERIRRYGDGDYIVFARNTDGSGAAVWRYKAGVFSLLADLADYDAEDAIDATLVTDTTLHVMRETELFIIDFATGRTSSNVLPRGETRAPFRVERLSDGSALWLFVTEGFSGDDTKAYTWKDGADTPVWTLPAALTLCQAPQVEGNTTISLAAGAALLGSADGAAPIAVHTFLSSVLSVGWQGVSAGAVRVGLAGGQIWRLVSGTWTLEMSGDGSPVQALGAWQGGGDALRGVAGRDDANLLTVDATGAWVLDRALTVPEALSETLDQILALQRYQKLLDADAGTYEPDRLLIGTGDAGLFQVLERADASAAGGAVAVSDFGGSIELLPLTELTPA